MSHRLVRFALTASCMSSAILQFNVNPSLHSKEPQETHLPPPAHETPATVHSRCNSRYTASPAPNGRPKAPRGIVRKYSRRWGCRDVYSFSRPSTQADRASTKFGSLLLMNRRYLWAGCRIEQCGHGVRISCAKTCNDGHVNIGSVPIGLERLTGESR